MLTAGTAAPNFVRQPVFGLPVEVPGSRILVLVFLRHLGCPYARESIHRLQGAVADMDLAGADLVVVTRTDLETARDFVPRNHLLFPVISDTEGTLFDLFKVHRDPMFKRSAMALLQTSFMSLVKPLKRIPGRPTGPVDQLPAEFIVDAGGIIRYSHYPNSIFHVTDPAALISEIT